MGNNKKDLSIETLRGLAIILMVAGHVIGDKSYNGMQVENDSLYRYFYFSFQYLRMPLFTVISGYVYALRPLNDGRIFKFLKGKGRRILIPMVTVATVQFLLKALVPDVNNPVYVADIWKIYVMPFDQFWFLQALFLVFITVALLEKFQLLKSWKGYTIIFLVSCALFLYFPLFTPVFSFNRFIYLLPFFLFGIGLNRYGHILHQPRVNFTVLFVFIVLVFIQQFSWYDMLDVETKKRSMLSLAIGLTGIYLLFQYRVEIPWLAWLGYYAFGIYLFGTAGSRILINYISAPASYIIFIISLIFGLIVPIVYEFIIMRSYLLKRIFLGLK